MINIGMEEEEGNSSFEDLVFPSNNSDELVGNTSGMTSTSTSRQDDHIEHLAEAIGGMSPFHIDPHKTTIQHETPSSFCAHPIHLHSLTRLTNIKTIVRSRFSTCAVCAILHKIVLNLNFKTSTQANREFHEKFEVLLTYIVENIMLYFGLFDK